MNQSVPPTNCFDLAMPNNGIATGTEASSFSIDKVAEALSSYPYFLLLRNVPGDRSGATNSLIIALMQRMLDESITGGSGIKPTKEVSLTDVRVNLKAQ